MSNPIFISKLLHISEEKRLTYARMPPGQLINKLDEEPERINACVCPFLYYVFDFCIATDKLQYLPCLFRILSTRDFQTFRADFTTNPLLSTEYACIHNKLLQLIYYRYPFLASFIDMEDKLKEIKHLIPLIQWTNIRLCVKLQMKFDFIYNLSQAS